MKWQLTLSSEQQQVYELWHNDKKLLQLDFHPFTNSARIQYAEEKRVFLIRKEGFLRNKTVLRNEYGIHIGQLGYEKSQSNSGTIELNDEKFFYAIRNNPVAELVIYKETPDKPFVVCALKEGEEKTTTVSFSKSISLKPSEHFLLMAVCWYMLLPVARENVLEYAS